MNEEQDKFVRSVHNMPQRVMATGIEPSTFRRLDPNLQEVSIRLIKRTFPDAQLDFMSKAKNSPLAIYLDELQRRNR